MIRDNSQAVIPFQAKDSNLMEGNIFQSNDDRRIANRIDDDIMVANAQEVASHRQFELMPIEDQIRDL